MDLKFMENLIPDVAGHLGISPSTVVFYLIVISFIGNLAGRLIPDDKTGWLGVVRDLSKILGGYVQNRISTGVKTGDVVKNIVESRVKNVETNQPQTVELSDVVSPEKEQELTEGAAEEVIPVKVVPAFPGLIRKSESDLPDFPKEF